MAGYGLGFVILNLGILHARPGRSCGTSAHSSALGRGGRIYGEGSTGADRVFEGLLWGCVTRCGTGLEFSGDFEKL